MKAELIPPPKVEPLVQITMTREEADHLSHLTCWKLVPEQCMAPCSIPQSAMEATLATLESVINKVLVEDIL
jgi:hypothetical protein